MPSFRMTLRDSIGRHPVIAFILLTLAWSWSIWSLLFLLIEQGGLLNDPPPLAYVVAAVGGCGPSLSGLLLTHLIYGREGMKALGARLRSVPAGHWWLALLIIPCISALTPLLRSLAGHAVDSRAMLGLIAPGLGIGLAAGLMEEVGWRGFLLPHLLKRHTPLVSSLLIGLIWGGLWHGYADYFGIAGEGPAVWLVILLLGPGVLTAWSLILTWVYGRTRGSLLLSILMHASISSSALIFGQKYASDGEQLIWTAISVGTALLITILLWLFIRQTNSQSPGAPAGDAPS